MFIGLPYPVSPSPIQGILNDDDDDDYDDDDGASDNTFQGHY